MAVAAILFRIRLVTMMKNEGTIVSEACTDANADKSQPRNNTDRRRDE